MIKILWSCFILASSLATTVLVSSDEGLSRSGDGLVDIDKYYQGLQRSYSHTDYTFIIIALTILIVISFICFLKS